MIKTILASRLAKPVLFIICLMPLGTLAWRAFYGDLGANPVETITHSTGDWTLRFLLVTLSISPLRRWFGLTGLMRFRRMLGLYVFFYACWHFSIWFIADHGFNFGGMIEDIVDRPYITVGFSALVLLIPLAITSNNVMVRRLGKSWKKLHRLVYLITGLGVLHFLWLVKADYLEPGIYALIAAVLLVQRINLKKWLTVKTSVQSG